MSAALLLCVVGLLVLETHTWRKYLRVRGELQWLRRVARDQLAISPGQRSTTKGLLALVDANRPAGVSLARTLDELQRQLDKGYP